MTNKKENILDDLLEEALDTGGPAFGGAQGINGTFSYSQYAGGKTWAPKPTTRSTSTDPMGYGIKDIADDEEKFKHNAPKKKPFPLETIDDFLVAAYLQLCNAESQLKTCDRHNSVISNSPEKKTLINHLYKKTKYLKAMIKNMSADINRLSFT